IPMNKDIVDEGFNGYFCDHDAKSISETIMKCLPKLEELKSGSVTKCASFCWDKIGERYLSCFKDIYVENSKKNISCPPN
ncbi:MAG: hypothetical protein SV375_23775, partial [Thermodesulfobacteriota bacterium]|nr:hypothetical protein [Thermodesulfobacteriota bacterium]